MAVHYCIGCGEAMDTLKLAGEQVSWYQRMLYELWMCENPDCPRFALIAIQYNKTKPTKKKKKS